MVDADVLADAFEHGVLGPWPPADRRSVVLAVDRHENLGAAFCLRSSTDGRTWTSDTIVAERSSDGGWAEIVSGGSHFGAIDVDETATWAQGWVVGGSTVTVAVDEAHTGVPSTAVAVTGLARPDVARIRVRDGGEVHEVEPRAPLGAYVALGLGTLIELVPVDRTGALGSTRSFPSLH